MEQNFTPNSHKYKAEQKAAGNELAERKKVNKVVTGVVKKKKKSEIHKFADIFISEDAANVKSYIFMDVLVPAIKKAISDIVTDGIDMILYGSTGRSKKRQGSTSSYVSYRSYSDRDRRDERRYDSKPSSRYSFDDLVFENKADGEEVLDRLGELISNYDQASVADLYDLVGMSCEYTDNRYGWTNISSAEVVRDKDGWILRMPRVTSLKS